MFHGITPKTFLSTPDELHAFLIGLFEILCPSKPRYIPSDPPPSPLKGEEHYYLAGRAAGFFALLLIFIGLAKLALNLWR